MQTLLKAHVIVLGFGMLNWELTKDGAIAKGKHTYHILMIREAIYLRSEDDGNFSDIGTFTGDNAFRDAMRVAEGWDK